MAAPIFFWLGGIERTKCVYKGAKIQRNCQKWLILPFLRGGGSAEQSLRRGGGKCPLMPPLGVATASKWLNAIIITPFAPKLNRNLRVPHGGRGSPKFYFSSVNVFMISSYETNFVEKFLWEIGLSNFCRNQNDTKWKSIIWPPFWKGIFIIFYFFAWIWLFLVYEYVV